MPSSTNCFALKVKHEMSWLSSTTRSQRSSNGIEKKKLKWTAHPEAEARDADTGSRGEIPVT